VFPGDINERAVIGAVILPDLGLIHHVLVLDETGQIFVHDQLIVGFQHFRAEHQVALLYLNEGPAPVPALTDEQQDVHGSRRREQHRPGRSGPAFPGTDLSPFPLIETVYLLFAGNTSTIFHDHSFLSLPFAAGSSCEI